MFSLSSCPVCNQQLEFFGISAVKLDTYERDDFGELIRDEKGNPIRSMIRNRWDSCASCGGHFEHDATGKTISYRDRGFTKDEFKRVFGA